MNTKRHTETNGNYTLTENARLLYLIRDRSWLDLEWVGNEVNCKPNKLWEIPYDTTNYFFRGESEECIS